MKIEPSGKQIRNFDFGEKWTEDTISGRIATIGFKKNETCAPFLPSFSSEGDAILLVNWTEAAEAKCSSFQNMSCSLFTAQHILVAYIENNNVDCHLFQWEQSSGTCFSKFSLIYLDDWSLLKESSKVTITPCLTFNLPLAFLLFFESFFIHWRLAHL